MFGFYFLWCDFLADGYISNFNLIRNSVKLQKYLLQNLKLKPDNEQNIINRILRIIESIRDKKLITLKNQINKIKSRKEFHKNLKLEFATNYLEAFVNAIKKENKDKHIQLTQWICKKKINQIVKLGVNPNTNLKYYELLSEKNKIFQIEN